MKMSEYTRNEWKKMKDQPLKVRLAFFWDYYKWPTIVVAVAAVALIYTVSTQLNRKEVVLSGMLINSYTPLEEGEFLQEFCDSAGINVDKQEITLLTGLSMDTDNASADLMTYQRIHAGIGVRETDFLILDSDGIRRCGYDTSHMLLDLREFLDPEQLASLEDRLYYIDGSLVEREDSLEGETATYPSPFAPDEMTDPIPVGIDIRDCTEFLNPYYSTEQVLYFAVVCNAPNMDKTLQFFEYIMEHIIKE